MKYIDADKLKVELDRQKIGYNIDGEHDAEYDTCVKILRIIDSLQQEQLEFPSSLDDAANSYASKTECAVVACRGFKAGAEWQKEQMMKAAQHVYESWMGGTMDDVRRDMVELGKALNARK